jgi:hypothetical protein
MQDDSFKGAILDPIPFIPNTYSSDWSMEDTEELVALSGCDDLCLKGSITAALASVWGVPDRFLAQIDAVFCLIHPMHPNHLAVIQRTSAGKMHIIRMLGVIKRGIILIFIPLLMLSADVMEKFTCANERFGGVITMHLDGLYDTNKCTYFQLLDHCCCLLPSTMKVITSSACYSDTKEKSNMADHVICTPSIICSRNYHQPML